jgi:hypothetical protein
LEVTSFFSDLLVDLFCNVVLDFGAENTGSSASMVESEGNSEEGSCLNLATIMSGCNCIKALFSISFHFKDLSSHPTWYNIDETVS